MKKYYIPATGLLLVLLGYICFDSLRLTYAKVFRTDVVIEEHNKEGQVHGNSTSYVSGSLYSKTHFINGKKEGSYTVYYPDGKLKQTGFFKNGKMDGPERSYHANGKLSCKRRWHNGREINSSTFYYSNGKIQKYLAFDQSTGKGCQRSRLPRRP